MDTAVLFETFARPQYARQVFDQIKKAKPKKLYFYSNKARVDRPDEVRNNEEIRSWVKEIDWDCELHTFFREEYVDVYTSVQGAMSWVVSTVAVTGAAAATASPEKCTAAATVPHRHTAHRASAPACRKPGFVTVNKNIRSPPAIRFHIMVCGGCVLYVICIFPPARTTGRSQHRSRLPAAWCYVPAGRSTSPASRPGRRPGGQPSCAYRGTRQ